MKKITDERLILKNLKNVRIAFIVQTIGILAILGYDLINGGIDQVTANPVWLVMMISIVVYLYLSMSISVAHEKETKNPRRSLIVSTIVLLAIVILVAYLTSITSGYSWGDGIAIGGIILVCGIIPIVYIYHLRSKQKRDNENE